MANIKLEIDGFDKIIKRLNQLNADTKQVAEKALSESFKVVQAKAKDAMQDAKLPAKGKYNTHATEKSLLKTLQISWKGDVAECPVGFDFKEDAGFISIFLMHGTPKMKPDKDLYNVFYGKSVKNKISEIQQDVFFDEIERLMQK